MVIASGEVGHAAPSIGLEDTAVTGAADADGTPMNGHAMKSARATAKPPRRREGGANFMRCNNRSDQGMLWCVPNGVVRLALASGADHSIQNRGAIDTRCGHNRHANRAVVIGDRVGSIERLDLHAC